MNYELKTKEKTSRGVFKKILSGGPNANWNYTLAIFVADEGENFSIYCTNVSFKLMTHYDITYTENPNSRHKSKLLKSISVSEPKNSSELEKVMLATNSGIGKATIEKMRDKFGENWIDNFKNDPQPFALTLSSNIYERLVTFFKTYTDKSYNFFLSNSLQKLHTQLVEDFGDKEDLVELLKTKNPYTLVLKNNYDFEVIDKLAHLLTMQESPLRMQALIHHSVNSLINNFNSTLVPVQNVLQLISKDSYFYKPEQVIEDIQSLIHQGILYFDNQKHLLSTQEMLEKEMFIASKLLSLKSSNAKKYESPHAINDLSELQQQAFNNAVLDNVSIISGFPGTGKSYIIKHLISFWLNNKTYKKSEIAVLAPTGRAAVNIKIKQDIDAKTIHSYFKITQQNHKNKLISNNNDIQPKVLIIDEFSMVNIDILHCVLENSIDLEKIVFVGDVDQLPCIGPGNLLDDLIKSNKFKTTKLVEIFRTDREEIPNHFLNIKENKKPQMSTEYIHWINSTEDYFNEKLIEIFANKINDYGIEDVAVLIPMHKTPHGIANINQLLQKFYLDYRSTKNDQIEYFTIGSDKKYYIGDKVIQNANDYVLDVYNGEIGFIKSYDSKNKIIKVDFGYKIIEYTHSEFLEYITLGYAISVHKFQGSESPSVIFCVLKEYNWAINTKLIYTAVSRAKDDLSIVGDINYYISSITLKNNTTEFITSFSNFLNMEV
ncbi:Exodeoxyribonuclease V alpha chain [Mycoplasmopsis bovigenitalium 51080]|uniref:Exodeoxyribonuclease V alpha chain n=1 Tax=Mycoplasmopsis bovigenitalium 51080 TaxID=1188235 RepID=N9V1L0_9BACT|nr:AAA family ATPase [Mycoplasmopsis bovigenitalium]ENY69257.1 Exodeoxyribonuclease V alpha chain [Mycoplasmopsis bovigenitalium 51080]